MSRFGKFNWYLVGGVGLWSGIRLYGQCHFQLWCRSAKGAISCGTPLTPWVVIGGCVSQFIPVTGRRNGSLLLGDCFFSPGCDVVLGCTVCRPCSHIEGGHTWTTRAARDFLGTLSRSTLVEVGVGRSVEECTPARPQGWEQRRRGASGRDRASVHSTFPTCAKRRATRTQYKIQTQSDVTTLIHSHTHTFSVIVCS